MSYLNQYRAYANPETNGRIAFAAQKIAGDVIREDVATEYHDVRHNFADKVLEDPMAFSKVFTSKCLTNPTVANSAMDDGSLSATDSDIEFVLSSIWTDTAISLRF